MPERANESTGARLFVALWPSAAVRDRLVAWQRDWSWPHGAAIVRPDDLHVTLHFLGNVATARLAELEQALQVPYQGFDLHFGSAEVWRGGLAVLEAPIVPDALHDLHAGLGAALRSFGIATETRPFRPHLTLARRAAGARAPQAGIELRWPVRAYVLVQSAGGCGGYVQRCRFPPGAQLR